MKKSMKKLQIVVLVLIMTLSISILSACKDITSEKPEFYGVPVNVYFSFDSYDQFSSFYKQFIECNPQRYVAPKATTGDYFDSVEYGFEAGGVDLAVKLGHIYATEFPSHKITFKFRKVDDSIFFERNSVSIKGELFDVSGERLNGKARLEEVDESKGYYNVYAGDILVCSFRITATAHFDKNEYINLILEGFAW